MAATRQESPMKHILDSSFQYKPSFATDVRKTFDRVRKQQRADDRSQAKPVHEIRVVKLDQLKKTGSP
jgi:hypothetical protein